MDELGGMRSYHDDYLRRREAEVKRELTEAAFATEGIAQSTVHVVAGHLKSTIYGRAAEETSEGVLESEAGATAEYAEIEEFRPGNHSYLRPAFDEVAPQLQRRLKELG